MPDPFFRLGRRERDRRGQVSSDLCQFVDTENRERFFVRAVLLVPVPEANDSFAWGFWAEVNEKDFDTIVDTWDDARPSATPIHATIANPVPIFEGVLGLAVDLFTQGAEDRPHLFIRDQDHPLAQQQARGLSLHAVVDILRSLEASGEIKVEG
ncbi:MAG: DUF2199 domain-containing protein [Phycisphaerae bacterium]|nr:DUF2199 domain-containing protein [Phycisphaerae bacterium]